MVDVEYAEESWFAVFGDNPGTSAYSYNSNTEKFTGQIEQRLDKGYDLTDVKYADGTWFAVFDDSSESSTYSTSTSISGFTAEIERQLGQGYDLIDVEYGDDTWLGVFNRIGSSTTSSTEATPTTEELDPSQIVIQEQVIQNLPLLQPPSITHSILFD